MRIQKKKEKVAERHDSGTSVYMMLLWNPPQITKSTGARVLKEKSSLNNSVCMCLIHNMP